jgi:hypothetical protein
MGSWPDRISYVEEGIDIGIVISRSLRRRYRSGASRLGISTACGSWKAYISSAEEASALKVPATASMPKAWRL